MPYAPILKVYRSVPAKTPIDSWRDLCEIVRSPDFSICDYVEPIIDYSFCTDNTVVMFYPDKFDAYFDTNQVYASSALPLRFEKARWTLDGNGGGYWDLTLKSIPNGSPVPKYRGFDIDTQSFSFFVTSDNRFITKKNAYHGRRGFALAESVSDAEFHTYTEFLVRYKAKLEAGNKIQTKDDELRFCVPSIKSNSYGLYQWQSVGSAIKYNKAEIECFTKPYNPSFSTMSAGVYIMLNPRGKGKPNFSLDDFGKAYYVEDFDVHSHLARAGMDPVTTVITTKYALTIKKRAVDSVPVELTVLDNTGSYPGDDYPAFVRATCGTLEEHKDYLNFLNTYEPPDTEGTAKPNEAKQESKMQQVKQTATNAFHDFLETLKGIARDGEKMATGRQAANIMTARVRKLAGTYYPTAITSTKIGKVMEPVVISGMMLLISQFISAFRDGKSLPFQSQIDDRIRAAMIYSIQEGISHIYKLAWVLFKGLDTELGVTAPSTLDCTNGLPIAADLPQETKSF